MFILTLFIVFFILFALLIIY